MDPGANSSVSISPGGREVVERDPWDPWASTLVVVRGPGAKSPVSNNPGGSEGSGGKVSCQHVSINPGGSEGSGGRVLSASARVAVRSPKTKSPVSINPGGSEGSKGKYSCQHQSWWQ